MRAVVVNETGGPEVLVAQDLPSPDPGPGELCVDVAAAGVNFIDVYFRTGAYPLPTPFIVGSEGAGVVSAIGSDVTGFQMGDHVAWAMVPGAGYAEQVIVPAVRAVPVPAGIDDETAGAVLLQGLTAQYLTRSTYPARPGETALVHAAAGGVGLLLTQVLSTRGVRVIATTSTERKAALALEAGATDVIRYDKDDVATEVSRLTDARGADVVYDGVGQATFEGSINSLRPRGMFVSYGSASGKVAPVDPGLLQSKGSLFFTRPTLGHYVAARDELLERSRELFGWVASGELSVRVGARYTVDQARQAHEDLESRRTTGKSLIIPGKG
ncbi:MAG TPA: quinone oxidoreductase [Dermatophilaceae bacterium]|nr:quinone oxidoreductase [Dermatophilaceae bacterium]